MALALLELADIGPQSARFKVDTGTNLFYQLKVGSSLQNRSGINWVYDVYFSTPIVRNPAGGQLLAPAPTVEIPLRGPQQGNSYVQLFSFKNADGRSPGFSAPLLLPKSGGRMHRASFLQDQPAMTMSMSLDKFRDARKVPCRTCTEAYAHQASLDDLLSTILKAAAPAVAGLLAGGQNGGRATSTPNSGAGTPDLLAMLLKTILGSLQGGPTAISAPQSVEHNRFHNGNGGSSAYVRPFIFGIDDALIGALAGPILQMLPGLMNSANQKRVQMKQADNKLITDILSETNRRLLMTQLLQAQQKSNTADAESGQPDFSAVIQLLQQAQATPPTASPPAPVATPPVPAPVAKGQSLDAAPSVVSRAAVVEFVTAEPLSWNGTPHVLYAKSQPLQLKLMLRVAAPAPKSPLPKAIIRITIKNGADQSVHLKKTFKQKDVAANSALSLTFNPEELAQLPANRPLSILAEFRWQSPRTGDVRTALGSAEAVFINKYFLKSQGSASAPERELTDLNRFRPFWNKVWESPVLDAANNRGGDRKLLWELDANGKYTVLLRPDQLSNGFMQTKLLRAPEVDDTVSQRITGRMKAGIELSMAELNKLCPLWDGAQPLDAEKLEAISTTAMARDNATEFVYNFKLKGKAAERGMVWVIPVFRLFDLTLCSVQGTNETGQVTHAGEEQIHFPLPVSARVLTMKSEQ